MPAFMMAMQKKKMKGKKSGGFKPFKKGAQAQADALDNEKM